MAILINILTALIAIFVVIIIHECGHFWVARAVGVKVLRFSIGFGKALWSRQAKSGTTYAIGVLPLGGYVKMLGEGDEVVKGKDASSAFNSKPVWARMAITLAGPLANFILAMVLFWCVYMGGMTHIKPVIGQVTPSSYAAKAGLRAGDEFISVAGQQTRNWQRVMMQLISQAGESDVFVTVKNIKTGRISNHRLDLASWGLKDKRPDVLKGLGLVPFAPAIPTIVDRVSKDSPASRAGVIKGDKIIAVQGAKVSDWQQVVMKIGSLPDKKITVSVLRSGGVKQLTVHTGVVQHGGRRVGFLGVVVKAPEWPANQLYHENFSVFSAFVPAWKQTLGLISFNAVVLHKMVTGNISVATLGGPISIFQNAGRASEAGVAIYIGFVAFISVALGFINLLPIPILDGGHFVLQLIELIFRKPVPMRFQYSMLMVGLFIILLVMVQATVNDISRMF
ncbi:MAG: RIP metalloprotease RseP [Gammaproteobacteria bacterium]|nr:RIP metalloprotease RseP [Gammaproteobacteria bacterium]